MSEEDDHRVQIKFLEEYAKNRIDRHIPHLMFGARSFVRATGRILLNHIEKEHSSSTELVEKLRMILEIAENGDENGPHNGNSQEQSID